MLRTRRAWLVGLLVHALLSNVSAVAQDVGLTTDCADGFRRFIQMAQTGQVGEGVTNANVAVSDNQARVELVRAGAPSTMLVLTQKRSRHAVSRYFDIVPGEGATAGDVERVGAALDEAFAEDPFRPIGLEGSPAGDPIPSLGEAWAYGSWRGVLRMLERRMMVLPSVQYTTAVIVALAVGLFASLALLWGSAPPRRMEGAAPSAPGGGGNGGRRAVGAGGAGVLMRAPEGRRY